jgi:hypothetical protein
MSAQGRGQIIFYWGHFSILGYMYKGLGRGHRCQLTLAQHCSSARVSLPQRPAFPVRVSAHMLGDFVCGHRVPWHTLTGTFVACNRRHLKSWVGNFSEGPFWMKWGQTKYCRDFFRSGPIAVPHVSISPFHVSSSVSIDTSPTYP